MNETEWLECTEKNRAGLRMEPAVFAGSLPDSCYHGSDAMNILVGNVSGAHKMKAVAARVVFGTIAGTFIGILAFRLLERDQTPLVSNLSVASIISAAYLGSVFAGRAVIGAFAGTFIGILASRLLYSNQEPVAFNSSLASIIVVACLGSAFADIAGNRSISVFWPYLVLIFVVMAFCPLWYYEKIDQFFPLGTAYTVFDREIMLVVLLPHILISIALAAIATLAHNKLVVRPGKPSENGAGG